MPSVGELDSSLVAGASPGQGGEEQGGEELERDARGLFLWDAEVLPRATS